MPTKSSGDAIVFSSSSVNVGLPPPDSARYSSVYFPSSITVMKPDVLHQRDVLPG
jgi:hypothetical protein